MRRPSAGGPSHRPPRRIRRASSAPCNVDPASLLALPRGLLAGIEPSQSWGIPQVARPRWQVFFKTGALPSQGLFNETARLERAGVTFTISIFTTGDPSMAYGEETIRGVARALLTESPPGA